jgi:hypothetical protein
MGLVAWNGPDGVADAFEEGHVPALGRQQGHERGERAGGELSVELEEGAVQLGVAGEVRDDGVAWKGLDVAVGVESAGNA